MDGPANLPAGGRRLEMPGLTAVVDRLGHHGLEPPGEAAIAVGEERREHEPNHAEVHLFGLRRGSISDHTEVVL